MFDGFVSQPLVEKKVNMPLLKLAGQESSFLSMSEWSCSLLVSCDQVLKRAKRANDESFDWLSGICFLTKVNSDWVMIHYTTQKGCFCLYLEFIFSTYTEHASTSPKSRFWKDEN